MASSSISVAVRVRPLTEREKNMLIPTQSSSAGIFGDGRLSSTSNQSANSMASHRNLRSIIRVLDQRVLIFDPPESNPLQQAQRQILARLGGGKKVKDMRFCFDRVFDENASQEDVYEGSARDLVQGVLDGFNATVFAYGATGCGKTHTITGTPEAPGIVYLLMKDLFDRISAEADDMTVEISISYLEIYNETIRDLLNPNAPVLNLREANSSVSVPGLTTSTPDSAADVIRLISTGNAHRTVHGTEANAVSSRSHAVLSVDVRRKARTANLSDSWSVATLSVIDLAGSERASVTKNKGERLLEGANINKSLLALGNCINALCDPKARGGHVPYRNSKLTRLLKHSLGGNCRTLMIVCVAPTSAHYDETHNALQYANRAKEIKTKATRNIISVDRHVSQYVQVIFQLRQELEERKQEDKLRGERMKLDMTKTQTEVAEAIDKAYKHWEDYILKAQPAARARGQLEGLSRISGIWSQWKEHVIRSGEEESKWLNVEAEEFGIKLLSERPQALKTAEEGNIKKSMYEACLTSLGRAIERQSGPAGKATFDRAIGNWTDKMGKIVLDSAFREGALDVNARITAQLMAWFLELKCKQAAHCPSEVIQQRLDEAMTKAFATLSSTSSTTAPVASTSSTIPTFNSTHFDLNTLKSSLLPKPLVGSESPPSSAENSTSLRLPKARRQSALASSTKVATTYFSKKASPRKHVVFPARTSTQQAATGILKSRPVTRSSNAGLPPPKLPLKAGGVRWRDEEGDGQEQLESFDETLEMTETTDASIEPSLSRDPPASSSSSISFFSNPSSQSTSQSSISVEFKPNLGETSDTTGQPRRSSWMKPGYLSRHRAPARLDSLGEEDEEDPTTPSQIFSRPALFEKSNTVRSDADLGFGSAPAPKKARRDSSIGPIRNPKPPRRQSMTFYQKKHRESLSGGGGSGSLGGGDGGGGVLRRAARVPRLGVVSETGNLSLSPRKLLVGEPTTARRRASMLPVPSGLSASRVPAWR